MSRLWILCFVGLIACGSDVTDGPSSSGGGGDGGGTTVTGGSGGEGGTISYSANVAFVDGDGVTTSDIRYGDAFAVVVSGLEPGGSVRLDSKLHGYKGWAEFVADDSGMVDTRGDAPSDGSYDGVSAEGLLWSMVELTVENITSLDITVSASVGGEEQHSAVLARRWLSEGLDQEIVSDSGLVGELYKPSGATAPLPGLIVLGGSEGGTPSFSGSWMAGYGYASLALAYFDEPGLPIDLEEIPLEYFETALDYMASRPDVDGDNIGVIGGSRGGELSLMLGARFSQVKAVVAEVPSGVRWGAVMSLNASGWSYMGMPLPYMSDNTGGSWVSEMLPDGSTGFRSTPVFDVALANSDPATIAAATIPVEQGQTPYLMLAGDDDGVWPSCAMAQISMDRLIEAGHEQIFADELICFEDAGHHAPFPGWPTTDSYAIDAFGTTLILGGTPKGIAHMQRDGLEKVKSFLATHLQD